MDDDFAAVFIQGTPTAQQPTRGDVADVGERRQIFIGSLMLSLVSN